MTLKDAIARLAEIPKSEHGMKQVHAAAHCITEAAENNRPMIFARIDMMQAINRYRVKEFDTSRSLTIGESESSREIDKVDRCHGILKNV